jgi:alginate O-acetyltransferase complex protein AlgJ
MQKHTSLLILPVLFLGSIYFLCFNQWGNWITFQQTAENRQRDTMPALNLAKLDDFPQEFESYLDDQFTFRKPFLNVYHHLKFKMHISPHPDKVIVGTDNWLFLGLQEQFVYDGKYPFYKPQLDSFRNIWGERLRFCQEHHASAYWLIAPVKQHVYAEHLPINIRRDKENRTLKLLAMLNRTYPRFATYPLQAFLNAKHNNDLFFRLDNHWNSAGGYIAYCELMQLIHQDNPEVVALQARDFSWGKTYRSGGNLATFIGYEDHLGETAPRVIFRAPTAVEAEKYGFPPPATFPYPHDYEHHYRNPKALNKQRVLLIRDSFGDAVIPFLNETFAETLCIFDNWDYLLHPEIIAQFKPDIVIFLTLETNTDNLMHPPAE